MLRTMILLLPILVAACGQGGQIEKAVREKLKDPDSAKFKDLVVSDNGERACVVWNAKNSMGGYGEWDVAELQKVNSSWKVNDMRGKESNCTSVGFKALDEISKAEFEATQKALEMLSRTTGQKYDSIKDYGNISGANASCPSYARYYVEYSGRLADKIARNDSVGAERYKVRADCSIKAITTGVCDFRKYDCASPETAKAALQCGARSCP